VKPLRPALLVLVTVLIAAPASAQVDGYPLLDNESIGLARALDAAVVGPPEQFDEQQWALETINSFISGGDVMSPFRYLIAFSAYSVGQAASHTPAWREPYRQTYQGYIDKMAQPVAWEDFMTVWGGESPLGPDNIMYTGHLLLMMSHYQQLFGDDRYEQPLTLTASDGATFQTDVHSLSEFVAEQVQDNTSNDGVQSFNVPCEPGRIFVPCNTPHRISDLIHDRAFGTDYTDSTEQWVTWVQEQMTHDESGVLYDLYWPYGHGEGEPSQGLDPVRQERLSGVYNAWTIWFLRAIAPEWGADLYPRFVEHFVVRDEQSPYPDGRPMVIDVFGQDGLVATLMNLVATGFGMVTARTYGDDALAGELQASWDQYFQPPQWSEDASVLSYTGLLLPLVFQNAFPLLSRTTSTDRNLAVDALQAWDPARFEQPYVASIGNEKAFVNQAVYDTAAEQLIVTLNGGFATDGPASIAIANLDHDVDYAVTRDGVAWDDVAWDGDVLVIETPGLRYQMESYVISIAPPVQEPPVQDEKDACACSAAPSATGALPALALLLTMRRRRR